MGKYKRYKNRLEMFLSSEMGKRLLGFLYSWGASIVLIGALFKLLHLPYANQILFVSMIVEAFVFFISGFERPGNDYHWEEVFPVLKSKNPLDRPDFAAGGNGGGITGEGTATLGGSTIVIGNIAGAGAASGLAADDDYGERNATGGSLRDGGSYAGGSPAGGQVIIGQTFGQPAGVQPSGQVSGQPVEQQTPSGGQEYAEQRTPQAIVNAGMASMGLNVTEQDSELLAESIKKLNGAAEQLSKMADLSDATQTYIDRITSVTQHLEKFGEITESLGKVTDTLVDSCRAISGFSDAEAEELAESPQSYVEGMTKLNENISDLNRFYEAQVTGLRSQMDTIQHINAGLNRIRDLYDTSIVDSASFRNENERMAQLLGQLNQVYSRLLHAMTVNMMGGAAYAPGQPGGFNQPPYPTGGGYR